MLTSGKNPLYFTARSALVNVPNYTILPVTEININNKFNTNYSKVVNIEQ